MKISLIITAIIVALFLSFGWRGRQRLDHAGERHDRILAEARERGLEKADTGEEPALSATSAAARAESERARRTRVKEAARKLTIFSNDRDAIGAMGPDGDQDKQLDFLEGMAEAIELDPAGLKLLVDEILANRDLTGEMRGDFVMLVGFHLVEKNPAGALALFMDSNSRLEIPADRFRNMVGFALEKLAGSNPRQALEWIRRNAADHPELVTEKTRTETLGGMAKSDAGLAFATLGEFGLTRNPEALEGIGRAATSADERSAVLMAMRDYAARAGSEEERQIAMQGTLAGMGLGLSRSGFDGASQWLESAKLSPDEAAGLAGTIDASLARNDTGKWIDWMSGNVPADQLAPKVEELVKFWAADDYRAAGLWLDSAPEGPAREMAVKTYAGAVAASDPGVAAQWALTLPAGEERADLMKTIYAEWKKQDAAAADSFAKENGIGE